jgi:D-alanyl-lipoteichoic acid acyltransferase DltB (MBOAT superfamily)
MSALLAAVEGVAGIGMVPSLHTANGSALSPALALGCELATRYSQLATAAMWTWPQPGPLYNPIVHQTPLSFTAVLAGPFGLVAFLPLVPIVLLLVRRAPRLAILLPSAAWLLLTLRWPALLVLIAGLWAGGLWLECLAALRRRGRLSQGGMKGLVWVGLHILVLPLWWQSQQPWYATLSPLAALHNMGFAYYLLRFIAWGVRLAEDPHQPRRWLDTVCWLAYPPCMRLGPVLLRETFLERFDQWRSRPAPDWYGGLRRFGLFLLGGVALGFVGRHVPVIRAGGDFFAVPEMYSTEHLLRVFYLVPIQIYLLLWTYNELAVATSRWIGIRVDDNFYWLPAATSVRDFWRRWHITVGAWLRDFIYIPLGGSRRNAWLNPFIVFGYCGLWHGASWSFLGWGLSQAVAITVERAWERVVSGQRRKPIAAETATAPVGPRWPVLAIYWLITLHYQLATVLVFADFEHLGLRVMRELLRRSGV